MFKGVFFSILICVTTLTCQAISPILYFGQLDQSQEKTITNICTNLEKNGFEILGKYNPANNGNVCVITFTNNAIKKATLSVTNRGALATAQKIAIVEESRKPNIYLLNPEYIFNAYLRDAMMKSEINEPLLEAKEEITNILEFIATSPSKMGGNVSVSDLKNYRYKIGMERFTTPVELSSFSSFDKEIETIQANLANERGNTKLVYSIIDKETETAVFGISLMDSEYGEPYLLPIIDKVNAVSLPYEIIVQNGKTTMLNARYRIPVFYPQMGMNIFSKTIRTQGKVKDALENLTR